MAVHPIHAALTSDAYVRTLIQIKALQMIRRPGFIPSDDEDREQELVAYVIQQSHHYDPARGSIHTFIDRVVNSRVAMLFRESRAGKRSSGAIRSLEDII